MSYKETAGVAIIPDKDAFQLLNVQRMISFMCECKQLQKNVPKLDCEWKARRFVVHQTFRSCTVYTVNLGLSWGFGAAIIKLYISQTHQQGLFCPNYRDAYRPTYHRSLFCSNTLWRGNTEVQTRPISQLWRKGHNLLLAAAWSTAQPTNPRKAKSSSAKLAPSPV